MKDQPFQIGDRRQIPRDQMLQTPAFIFACWLYIIAAIGLTRSYDNAPPQATA